jgi:putative ABC transport system ATP-binding protein
MNKLITARKVTKTFDIGEIKLHAVNDISFDIYEGELVVILGPSGSGKSTMLNIIGGIDTVTDGEIFYKDIPLHQVVRNQLTAYRRNYIGFIFQFYNLMPNLTALENIELASEMSKEPLDPQMLLERVELADRGQHFPGKLSGVSNNRKIHIYDSSLYSIDKFMKDGIIKTVKKLVITNIYSFSVSASILRWLNRN